MPMVINPKPPIWIRQSSTICPKRDQWVKVSTTIRPVTQVALVAVNTAVIKGVDSPFLDAIGSIKAKEPASIMRKNPRAIICGPDKRFFIFVNITCLSNKIV